MLILLDFLLIDFHLYISFGFLTLAVLVTITRAALLKFLIPFCLHFSKGESILADSGTEQLEFIALSQRTGDPKYQQKVFHFNSICSIF